MISAVAALCVYGFFTNSYGGIRIFVYASMLLCYVKGIEKLKNMNFSRVHNFEESTTAYINFQKTL